jgi:SRSO17 transposase
MDELAILRDAPVEQLIRLAKLRWRVERDYEELKGPFGLDHYEGRGVPRLLVGFTRSWKGYSRSGNRGNT